VSEPARRSASYDPGERIRVTKDAKGTLRVLHGAAEVATIKRILTGGLKVEADGRAWRLEETPHGWIATAPSGTEVAELRNGVLRAPRLRVGRFEAKVSRSEVKGVLGLKMDRSRSKPVLAGTIQRAIDHEDPHALIAFAAAALVLDKDLEARQDVPSPNGDNISAALRYGMHH
jgi:hypothetical protein